jgi:predicted amidohydrolase
MQVAAVQMRCSSDRSDGLDRAETLVVEAAALGARLVVLPELFASLHRPSVMRDRAEPIDGPTVSWARQLAATTSCSLVAGSFVERAGDDLFNTSCLVGPDGGLRAVYRKIHLFDVDLESTRSRESDVFTAGSEPTTAEVDGERIGLTICYDLRFPELYRIETLLGAQMIVVPSAFTAATGSDHWELLVRARAVENQVAMIAAAQWGTSPDGIERHGHALIVDAWGRVLADAGDEGDSVVIGDNELETQADIRRRFPSLGNRQPKSYRWPD